MKIKIFLLIVSFLNINGLHHFINLDPCNDFVTLCGSNPHDHIMCNPYDGPLENCTNFKLFPMTNEISRLIVNLHNAVRNMEAARVFYEIPNMNLLVWDDSLADMAYQYILRCNTKGPADDCRYIGDTNHTIGQNFFYSTESHESEEEWIEAILQTWGNYSYSDMTVPFHFKKKAKYSEYTQFIWPTSQFVGCAGARVADGVLFVCYYNPKGNEGLKHEAFLRGEACSRCPRHTVCSELFTSLCQINDIGFIGNQPNLYWIVFINSLSWVICQLLCI